MQALILAAGRGSRLGRLTEDKPKCMVELKGKPLIEWQLDAIRNSGNGPVAVVGGYRSEVLKPYADVFFTNTRWQETNMVTSLMMAGEWLRNATTIISYSDIFYESDAVSKLVAEAGSGISIGYDPNWLKLWGRRFENPLDDAETFRASDDGYLLEIGNKPESLQEVKGQYMGLLVITPSGFKEITAYLKTLTENERDRLDMTGMLKALIRSGVRVRAIPLAFDWGEIDSETDLKLYESIF